MELMAEDLVPGRTYLFTIKPDEIPVGESVPRKVKTRIYLEMGLIEGVCFYKVRAGSSHKIYLIEKDIVLGISELKQGVGF